MIFTIFTVIVFISQIVILCAIIIGLLKLDKSVKQADAFLEEAKPKIKDISKLAHGISEQMAELTPMWVDNIKSFGTKLLLKKLESLISLFLFWGINKTVMKKFRKSKFLSAVAKGLSFVNNMI